MKILVFGAGAIGSVFGGFLARHGEEVTLLGRSAHMEAISKNGLRITGLWGDFSEIRPRTFTDVNALLSSSPQFDLILLTVRAYDTEAALADVTRLTSDTTKVVSLQNGLGNVEKLLTAIGPTRAIGGRVIFGSKMRQPGVIEITVSADVTAIGPLAPELPLSEVEEIAKLFTKADLATMATPNIREVIFAKVLYNASLNGLSSLRGVPYGELLNNEEDKEKMHAIVIEGYRIAEAQGLKLDPPSPEEYIDQLFGYLIPVTAAHRSSMLEALEQGKRTEIDYLNGALVRFGEEYSIETTVNRWVWEQIKSKERQPAPHL